ncbi:uncharacterized protein [Lolium perenne]|uniref:uncharacterized protein n=1 Tax=Lolium perenne TaxID=4522 RepID=UPI0021F69190|nr:uncharacterized protein LOC127336295 [Lolium perenne]
MIAEEDKPVIGGSAPRRRKSKPRKLFPKIFENLREIDYLKLKRVAVSELGFLTIQKCTVDLRMLPYGIAGDTHDDYLRMAESMAINCMYRFCREIVVVFEKTYLRTPNAHPMRQTRLGSWHKMQRGVFVGCLAASTICTGHGRTVHSHTRECKGHKGAWSVVHDLWIWHAFFSMAGSHNDINVLQFLDVFQKLVEGNAPSVQFEINGHQYDKGYYLAGGIYPRWSTFVKTILNPVPRRKKTWFAQLQEAAIKDVERVFGVLQARFALSDTLLLHGPKSRCGRS